MRAAGLLLAIVSSAVLCLFVSAAPPPPALHAVAGPAAVDPLPPVDPFPIRRQFITDDQIDRLTSDPRGPFQKLTKLEFETKIRAASDALRLARTPPQLVSAAYRGRYEPGQLTGSAKWVVANPSGEPGLVSLDSLRLAVTDLKVTDDQPALLFRGKPGGKDLVGSYLGVGGRRETALSVGWSLRGVEEADEERFDLSLPTAAIATLDLTFPADRLPTLSTSNGKRVEATGPFPAGNGNRTWKWTVGGLSGVALGVRPADTPGAEVTASRVAVFDLSPGVVSSTFDFTLDSTRGLIREHTFTTDTGIKVAAVSGDGIASWRYTPPDGTTQGRLTVTWREPTSSARLKVSATTTIATGPVGWACPGVQPTGALPGGDVIEVNLSPEMKLDGWTPGDYRAGVSTPSKGLSLQFVGTLTNRPEGVRRPPNVRVRSATPELVTDETLTWRVEPGRTHLTAEVRAQVVHGPLPHLVVKTAPGYVLESAAVVPEASAASFDRLSGTPNAWVVELSRAVPTGRTVEVTLEFRGPPGPTAPDPADPAPMALSIPFPAFAMSAATDRQGTLKAIGNGVATVARTMLPVTPDGNGWVVKYRGKEPQGVGLFSPKPAGVTVESLRLAVRNRTCETTLVGRADGRPVGALTVFVPHPRGTVRVDEGASAVVIPTAELIPLLTATSGWHALTGAATASHGSYWRVLFSKPRTGPFEVTAEYPAPVGDPETVLTIPLPRIGGSTGEPSVELSAELTADFRPGRLTAGPSPPTLELERVTAKPTVVAAGEWDFSGVQQLNRIDGDGGLVVTLTGRALSSVGRTLPIALPKTAVAETAQVDGKWATVTPGEVVTLPLPALPPEGVGFEIRYRLPAAPSGPLPSYESPPVGMPTATPMAIRWQFDKGWLPWPSLSEEDECEGQSQVRVVRVLALRGVGFAVGGFVLALGIRTLLRGSWWRLAVLVGVVTGCGIWGWSAPLGWLKVLEPPLFAGLVVLVLAAFRRPPAQPVRSPSTVLRTPLAVAVAAIFAHAQPVGEPAVVYVVGSDARAVYAPQAVLDRLDRLSAPLLPDVVITRADYSATAGDAAVQCEAVFTLECPREGEHVFTLPLSDVRLEAMKLDGKEAFPDASKADRYTLTVTGRGTHTLTTRFALMAMTTGGDREARFSGPEVHRCTVTFDAGANGRQPDVSTRRGQQTVAGRVATAEHGAGRGIALRWREQSPNGEAKSSVSVKEAGVWDATDSPDAGVWAAFAYTVMGGGVEQLEIDVPDGLVPTRLFVRPTTPRGNPVGVRGWRIAPVENGTRVIARLQQPTEGRVLVLIRAVPKTPLPPNPVLTFPRAANLPDADRDSVYAVRFPGVESAGVRVTGAIDFPADAIVKDFPAVPEFGFDKQPPARVVKRAPNSSTELRPTLTPTSPFTALGAEVVYTCGEWVEVEGAARVEATSAGVIEFTVPSSVDVRDVRVTGLAGWGRAGSRIQLWLKSPAAGEVLVRWAGSLPFSEELPLPQWLGRQPTAEPTVVRVRAADGFNVNLNDTKGLTPMTGTDGETTVTFEGTPPVLKVSRSRVPLAPARATTPQANDPPSPRPPSPPAPTGDVEEPPPPVSFNPWPYLAAASWGVGVLGVAVVLRGGAWRPERVTALGVLGWLAAGIGTPLGWGFAAAAGVGLLWRVVRVVRGVM